MDPALPGTPRYWRQRPSPLDRSGPWPFALAGLGGACAWLRSLLPAGGRLGLVAVNRPEIPALMQAMAWLGRDLVVFHQRLTDLELSGQISEAACDRIVGDPRRGMVIDVLPEHFPEGDPGPPGTGGALILHTSGTTGAARAVRLPWTSVRAAAEAGCSHLSIDPDDAWLACLPLDHVGGAMVALRAAVAGCTLEIHERFTASLVAEALRSGRCRSVSLVPTTAWRLLRVADPRPFPSATRCVIGGGPLGPDLAAELTHAGLTVLATYGLTETCAMVTCQTEPGPADCGRLLPGVEIAIRDADSRGIGAIVVRSPHGSAGYERGGRLCDPPPGDGWFRSGDLGQLIGDRLTVIGRSDEVIITGGEKVAPTEVEAVLLSHPAVRDAGVWGQTDPEWGVVVMAAVVLDGTVTDAELDAWCAMRLAPHRRPRQWRRLPSLPRTTLGKLRREALRTLLGAPPLDA